MGCIASKDRETDRKSVVCMPVAAPPQFIAAGRWKGARLAVTKVMHITTFTGISTYLAAGTAGAVRWEDLDRTQKCMTNTAFT